MGYDVLVCSNDKITPVDQLDNDGQKIVIFDDYLTEKNQAPLIQYFLAGRHKNTSCLFLSHKNIRLNCSHFCVFDFPSSNERNLISCELGVTKEQYLKSTQKPYSFLYVDKPMKSVKINFMEIYNVII